MEASCGVVCVENSGTHRVGRLATRNLAHLSAMSLDGTAAVRAPVRVVGAWEDFVAGGVGGVGICVVTHPFDTVKVLRQTQHERYGSAMSAARAVVAAQGVSLL